jgi:ribosomal protein S18 acetylase RimI-like enzyme
MELRSALAEDSKSIAELNGQFVGFTVYSLKPGYLYQLFTSPEFHHLGIGSALFHHAVSCMSRPWKRR